MKSSFSVIALLVVTILYSQNMKDCNLLIQYDYYELENIKHISFIVKNDSKKKIKVPETINPIFVNIDSVELYNIKTGLYDSQKYSIDVDCFSKDCYGKMISLKPNEERKYIFPLNNKLYFREQGAYRFKIRLMLEFNKCYEFFTDWLYYEVK